MALLNMFFVVLFFPGDFILKRLNITVEQDEGIMRSFLNSIIWGGLVLGIGLKFFT
ncbi:MAG: hypothetical protein JKY82_10190 [Rhizobiaceae bacterium]|nr:hypothetical protein [Rhizobiaceae bacterium]